MAVACRFEEEGVAPLVVFSRGLLTPFSGGKRAEDRKKEIRLSTVGTQEAGRGDLLLRMDGIPAHVSVFPRDGSRVVRRAITLHLRKLGRERGRSSFRTGHAQSRLHDRYRTAGGIMEFLERTISMPGRKKASQLFASAAWASLCSEKVSFIKKQTMNAAVQLATMSQDAPPKATAGSVAGKDS